LNKSGQKSSLRVWRTKNQPDSFYYLSLAGRI
jgi:hypothetical protein